MADIILLATLISNSILLLLLFYRGWNARLQWLTIETFLAILVDCAFRYIHNFAHHLYAPLRIFIVYWLFTILAGRVAFEGFQFRIKWLEYLFLIQLGLTFVGLFAHLHGDPWAVYWIEIFNTYFNIFGIWLCIVMLRGEPRYEPSEART